MLSVECVFLFEEESNVPSLDMGFDSPDSSMYLHKIVLNKERQMVNRAFLGYNRESCN